MKTAMNIQMAAQKKRAERKQQQNGGNDHDSKIQHPKHHQE